MPAHRLPPLYPFDPYGSYILIYMLYLHSEFNKKYQSCWKNRSFKLTSEKCEKDINMWNYVCQQ